MKALILSGGKSSRMRQDKASLVISGSSLLNQISALLKPLVSEVFLSVAHDDQQEYPMTPIADLEPQPGPLGGLQAAFAEDANATWFLVAVDLPRLKTEDLRALIDQHDPSKDATCFLNPLDQHPEPLCAIYSPSAAVKLESFLNENQRCARRFLATLNRRECRTLDPQTLLNLNRPEQLVELETLNQCGSNKKEVIVEYFAKLSQEAQTHCETLQTTAATLTGLWEEVRLKHGFTLDFSHIKPAINNEFAQWTSPLESGQIIAFMPPFAGG
jgi:molybdopterin-guanine dinucleotide biosynthesis protein A